MSELILVILALLPAIALCIYIFKMDKIEKEPVSLLAILLLAGALIAIPVILVGQVFLYVIESMFSHGGYFNLSSLSEGEAILYHFINTFFHIGPVEEGFKFLALFLITKNNKNFTSLFDGIVYATFVSLGFAGLENILYSLNNGFGTAIIRMVTAVPAHTFYGVFMGFYYGWYHIKTLTNKNEAMLVNMGVLDPGITKTPVTKDLVFSLLIPIVVHAFYDFCCMVGYAPAMFVFYVFLIFLYVFCFLRIKKVSNEDMEDKELVLSLIAAKHPPVRDAIGMLYEYKATHDMQPVDAKRSRITFTELVQVLALIRGQDPTYLPNDSSRTIFISARGSSKEPKKQQNNSYNPNQGGYNPGYGNYNQNAYQQQANPYQQNNYPQQSNPYQQNNYPPQSAPYNQDNTYGQSNPYGLDDPYAQQNNPYSHGNENPYANSNGNNYY